MHLIVTSNRSRISKESLSFQVSGKGYVLCEIVLLISNQLRILIPTVKPSIEFCSLYVVSSFRNAAIRRQTDSGKKNTIDIICHIYQNEIGLVRSWNSGKIELTDFIAVKVE